MSVPRGLIAPRLPEAVAIGRIAPSSAEAKEALAVLLKELESTDWQVSCRQASGGQVRQGVALQRAPARRLPYRP